MGEKKMIGVEKYRKIMQAIRDKCTEETFKDVRSFKLEENSKTWSEVEHYIIDALHVYIEYSCTPDERKQGILTISKDEKENYFEEMGKDSSNMEMREYPSMGQVSFLGELFMVDYDAYNNCGFEVKKNGSRVTAPINEITDYECNPLFIEYGHCYNLFPVGERHYMRKIISQKTELEKMGTSLSGTDLGDFELIVNDAIRILTEYLKDKEPNACAEERAKLASLKEMLEFYKSVERVAEKDLVVEEKPEDVKVPEEKPEDTKVSDDEKNLEDLSIDELREMLERKEKENEDKKAQIAEKREKAELLKKIKATIKEGKELDEELDRLEQNPSVGEPNDDTENR